MKWENNRRSRELPSSRSPLSVGLCLSLSPSSWATHSTFFSCSGHPLPLPHFCCSMLMTTQDGQPPLL